MNIDSILISEYASLSSLNELTVVRVFNHLTAKQFPATHQWLAISLVIHAHRDERGTDHQMEIRIVGVERKVDMVIHEGTFAIAEGEPPPGMPLRHLYVHRLVQTQFPEAGPYAFEVYIDGTYHAASTIYLEQT